MVNISLLFGFFTSYIPELGGVIGYEMNLFFQDFMGKTGTLLVLLFSVIIFIVLRIKIDPDKIEAFFKRK
jgi:S-DNA-T family DNA segregation ATPase FtsK/SpoIIIE